MQYPTSTIAMSLYNVVAGEGAATLDEARAALARHGYLLAMSELEVALRELVERGHCVVVAGRIEATGPAGHVIVSRDRSDPQGWTGWRTAPHAPSPSIPLVGRSP
jgi:hypothetical protein